MNHLGLLYHQGTGIEKNQPKAFELFLLSAKQNNKVAQSMLGEMLANGHGVKKDLVQAREWMIKSAEQGCEVAINALQQMDAHKEREMKRNDGDEDKPTSTSASTTTPPTPTPTPTPTPKQIMTTQQRNNATVSCAICHQRTDIRTSEMTFMTCCGQLCHPLCGPFTQKKPNCFLCQKKLAKLGSSEDIRRIRRWADEENNKAAQTLLAQRYKYGVGVPINLARTKHYYELALLQNSDFARKQLGYEYYHGEGNVFEQSYEKSKQFYESSVEWSADPNAQNNLANHYYSGYGTEKYMTKAFDLYLLSANQGNKSAQAMVGGMYASGQGVALDLTKGIEWLRKSAQQNWPRAIQALKQMGWEDGENGERKEDVVLAIDDLVYRMSEPLVQLHSLVSAHSLNGQIGRRGVYSTEKRRYLVRFEKNEKSAATIKPLWIKETNMTIVLNTKKNESRKKKEEPQPDECAICLENLPRNATKLVRYMCCGKGLHKFCGIDLTTSNLTNDQKYNCPFCRSQNQMGGTAKGIQRLTHWIQKGKPWAMTMMAQWYISGLGVKQSFDKARVLYETAAHLGDANAMTNLANMYNAGLGGVVKDDVQEKRWLMKAASVGDFHAISNLRLVDKACGLGVVSGVVSSFVSTPISCWSCGKDHSPENKLIRCNGCQCAYYCNRECQKNDWLNGKPKHKEMCKKLQVV